MAERTAPARHAVSTWWVRSRSHLRAQLQYPWSFAIDLVSVFTISFLDFVAVLILFTKVDVLGGWTVGEVALLYGVTGLAFSFADLVVGHLDRFPRMVRDGTFDELLVRPAGSLTQVVSADFSLRKLGKTLQSGAVLAWGTSATGSHVGALDAVVLLVAVCAGAVLFASVWIACATISFWWVEARESVNAFTYGGNFVTQYPFDIYGRWLQRVVVYVLPFGCAGYFPVAWVVGHDAVLGIDAALATLVTPVVAVATAVVARTWWNHAVRHYRSAGG